MSDDEKGIWVVRALIKLVAKEWVVILFVRRGAEGGAGCFIEVFFFFFHVI
jgi:hypothetical protein